MGLTERPGDYALPVFTLAFLFIGFIKGVVWSPVDLTVVCAALVVGTLALVAPADALAALRQPAVITLAVLATYLAARLLPDAPAWGVRKLAETVLFGAPAIAAGYVIATNARMLRITANILCWSALPITAAVVFLAATGEPYTTQEIGTGGYFLTGTVLAASAAAAAHLKRFECIAISALGLIVVGHVASAAFGGLAVLILLCARRQWTTIVKSATLLAVLIAIYSALVSPPVLFLKIVWKVGGYIVVQTTGVVPSADATAALEKSGAGRAINFLLQSMPDETKPHSVIIPNTNDRPHLFRDAFRYFLQAPIFGNGYGAPLDYAGTNYPHNMFLELMAEGGIVAAALLAVALGTILLRIRPAHGFAFGFFFVVVLTGMMSGYWAGRTLMFGLGLAIGAAAARSSSPACPPRHDDRVAPSSADHRSK